MFKSLNSSPLRNGDLVTVLYRGNSTRPIESMEGFLCYLRMSRLLSESELECLQQGTSGKHVDTIAQLLVDEGILTRYQLRRIQDGHPRGLIIGPYTVLDELGEGGFGLVYKGLHRMTKREVALKVIAPKLVQDPDVRELFLREVLAATRLNHPNIAFAYDANEEDETLFLALEYIDGPNLERWINQQGPLPVHYACALMLQTANALQYTHELGMLHRDIKPSNMLLPGMSFAKACYFDPANYPSVMVKLIDFGLARLHPFGSPQSGTIRQNAEFVGTPDFISPEQACDFHKVDIRSDLYSLGCTFYFALTGVRPFQGTTSMQTISMHLRMEPEPIRRYRPELSAEMAAIVERLMAKKPEDRFQTPAELGSSLTKILQDRCSRNREIVLPQICFNQVQRTRTENQEQEATSTSVMSRIPNSSQIQLELVPNNPGPILQLETVELKKDAENAQESPGTLGAELRTEEQIARVDRLPERWRAWTDIVERFAMGLPCECSETEYEAIYSLLIKELHEAPASTSNENRLRSRLEAIAEPWLSLRGFRDLDARVTRNLWQSCLSITDEFDPPVAPPYPKRRFLYSAVIGIVFLLGAWQFGRVIVQSVSEGKLPSSLSLTGK